jgi:hypothetical protein
MDIKLIFSDIDGTILPHKGQVSPATVETVRACREKGVEFVIASGLAVFRPGYDNSYRRVFERADQRMYDRKGSLKAMGKHN